MNQTRELVLARAQQRTCSNEQQKEEWNKLIPLYLYIYGVDHMCFSLNIYKHFPDSYRVIGKMFILMKNPLLKMQQHSKLLVTLE